jgi:4a-hydroxytetrahydrobiopterin dehydratase
MTEALAEKTCTPCRGGVPPLARDELAAQETGPTLGGLHHRI